MVQIQTLRLLALLLWFLAFTHLATASEMELVIDITAQPAESVVERPIAIAGLTNVHLRIMHGDSGAMYDLEISVDNIAVPAVSLGGASLGYFAPGSNQPGGVASMIEMNDSANIIADGISDGEGKVRRIASASSDGGAGAYASGRVSVTALVVQNVVELRPGQQMKVVVIRYPDARYTEARWTTVFNTGERGKWNVSIGFGCPILIDKNYQYYTQRDTASGYVIMRQESDETIQLVPAVFFHWLPSADELEDWSWSVTGGLGIDFEDPVLFLGGSVSYNRNITIAAGAVAHKLERLNKRYAVGQTLLENLDSEQLHDQYYRINPFVGVTFRVVDGLFGR